MHKLRKWFWKNIWLESVAHLAWKKGVCRGREAFDITFHHKNTLSPKTRNRLMNFAMLPKYWQKKSADIQYIGNIC